MPVAKLTLELSIPHAQSLKDRRQVVRSLKDKLRHGFNVSIAELRDGEAITVTDYWGEPTATPEWRQPLTGRLDMEPLSAMRLQDDDVMAVARDHGIKDLDGIDTAILETFGDISIIEAKSGEDSAPKPQS